MADLDLTKRKRVGPTRLPVNEKRSHTVSVRLNDAELAALDTQRSPVQMQRGEYLRAAALHRLPPIIPETNQQQWIALSRSAANINQIARKLNESGFELSDVNLIKSELTVFRMGLIGTRSYHIDEDSGEELDDES